MIDVSAGATDDAEVARLRSEISSLDREILELVIRRIDLARQIWEHKLVRGIALVDPAREEELLDELHRENGGRLSGAGVAALHAELLMLTKRELEQLLDPL